MPKSFYFIIVIFIIISAVFFVLIQKSNPMVIIDERVNIEVEIAKTRSEQITGLSNRQFLSADSGMLFVYSNYAIRSFWMKDMNFSIDIIWIKDNQIVGFAEKLKPEGQTPTRKYLSPVPVNYVLEVPAGFVSKNSIKIGSVVQFKN